MKKLLTLLLVIAAQNLVFSQNDYSVHKAHKEQFGKTLEKAVPPVGDVSEIIPLQVNPAKELSAAVFGYLPDWEYLDNNHQYLRYDLLTHIAAFDFPVSTSGSMSNPGGWPWTDLINEAHQNGVKVILTAVNFNAAEIRTIITDQAVKAAFFENVKAKIETYQLDGVNIDFEALYPEDRALKITSFMTELTNYIHTELPGKEVSFAGPPTSKNNTWDLTGLVRSCDYVFIMGYAFAGSWSTSTWANAPLTGGVINITRTVTNDYGVAIRNYPDKVILGLPYYGHRWITTSQGAHAPVLESLGSTRFREDEPASQVHGLLWDLTTQTPWYRKNLGGGEWEQTWFDNDSSLGLKYDLAISKNMKGIGMWALGYDGERQELWNLIDRKFGTGEIPAPDKPQSFRVVAESQASLTMKFEVPDYATGFEPYISRDGVNFEPLPSVPVNSIQVDSLSIDSVYYFKVRAFNNNGFSDFTEVLAGIPAMAVQTNLIVNGFDRVSNTTNTFDYITRYGPSMLEINEPFMSASNEAVFNNLVTLSNYEVVIWMLGDESTADETFNSLEQDRVKDYLNGGGKLFVSGAEIGWDLVEEGGSSDRQFYNDYLRAEYISDAPNNQSGTYYTTEPTASSIFDGLDDISFDDGSHGTFDVDWPDAIEALPGGEDVLNYKNLSANNGFAGIAYTGTFPEGSSEGRLVYLAFPYETIYPYQSRLDVMTRVYDYFDMPSSASDELTSMPGKFELHQNYPNPFNPSTRISFDMPSAGDVKLSVFNVLGEKVAELLNGQINSGRHNVEWDASGFASGMYIYQLHVKAEKGADQIMRKKMLLVK